MSYRFRDTTVQSRDVEAVKFLMLLLPTSLEVLCFRVRLRFMLYIKFYASEFASASSLFHQSASASTKI